MRKEKNAAYGFGWSAASRSRHDVEPSPVGWMGPLDHPTPLASETVTKKGMPYICSRVEPRGYTERCGRLTKETVHLKGSMLSDVKLNGGWRAGAICGT